MSVSMVDGHIDPDRNGMTPQEAIEDFKIALPYHKGSPTGKVYGLAIEALEKQIPKKPVNKTKCDNFTAKHYKNCSVVVCPLCNGRLKLKSKGKNCDKCGQALDWSDTE